MQFWWHLEFSPMWPTPRFWPPKLQENKFVQKPLSLWGLVTAAVGNSSRGEAWKHGQGSGWRASLPPRDRWPLLWEWNTTKRGSHDQLFALESWIWKHYWGDRGAEVGLRKGDPLGALQEQDAELGPWMWRCKQTARSRSNPGHWISATELVSQIQGGK